VNGLWERIDRQQAGERVARVLFSGLLKVEKLSKMKSPLRARPPCWALFGHFLGPWDRQGGLLGDLLSGQQLALSPFFFLKTHPSTPSYA
jgi:hypothetical protein